MIFMYMNFYLRQYTDERQSLQILSSALRLFQGIEIMT